MSASWPAASTRRAYERDWRGFAEWCRIQKVDPTGLPVHPVLGAAYLAGLVPIHSPHSKRDQEGQGADITIPWMCGEDSSPSPRWANPSLKFEPTTYIFRPIGRLILEDIMGTAADMLKPSEAAVVARVALRDVNRVIDERILPEAFFSLGDGRRVAATACSLISFYFDSAKRLTSEERLFAIREAGSRLHRLRTRALASLLEEDWIVRDEFLTIDLAPFVRRTNERMDRLAAGREMVVSDPEILGGTPVIRGTRIPVYDVAASVAAGLPMDRILAAYPSLDADKVELAAIYAEANPMRGRPRSNDEFPKGATIVTDRRVRRRRKTG